MTTDSSGEPAEEPQPSIDEKPLRMRCPVHGTFMRRMGGEGHYFRCLRDSCKELRDDRPEHNFALMLLGFTSKAARP